MPPFGPTHPPLHSVPFMTHWRPFPENAQGAGSSSTSISESWPPQKKKKKDISEAKVKIRSSQSFFN